MIFFLLIKETISFVIIREREEKNKVFTGVVSPIM